MNFNLKTALGTIAPTLATMLGGPLAGTAVTALESALGLAPGSGADAVTAAVAQGMTPETIAAVRAADQHHLEEMGRQQIDLVKLNADHQAAMEQIAANDRASARDREVKSGDRVTPRILAFAFVVGWFGVQAWLLGHVIPPEMREVIMRTLGTLDMALGLILGYYFGSSASSASKDDTIQVQAKSAAGSAP